MIPRAQLACENIVRLCSGKPEMTAAEEDEFIREYRRRNDELLARHSERDRLNPPKNHPSRPLELMNELVLVAIVSYLIGAVCGACLVVFG